MRVYHNLGASEDVHELLVRRKAASTCQGMPHGLLLLTLVKSTSIEGLKTAMGWFWTERTLVYVGNKVKMNLSQQLSAVPES